VAQASKGKNRRFGSMPAVWAGCPGYDRNGWGGDIPLPDGLSARDAGDDGSLVHDSRLVQQAPIPDRRGWRVASFRWLDQRFSEELEHVGVELCMERDAVEPRRIHTEFGRHLRQLG